MDEDDEREDGEWRADFRARWAAAMAAAIPDEEVHRRLGDLKRRVMVRGARRGGVPRGWCLRDGPRLW